MHRLKVSLAAFPAFILSVSILSLPLDLFSLSFCIQFISIIVSVQNSAASGAAFCHRNVASVDAGKP